MDYWEWVTAIMVVLVVANLIRMNMWLTLMSQHVQFLYDEKKKEQEFADDIVKQIRAHHENMLSKPVDNSAAIKEWDESLVADFLSISSMRFISDGVGITLFGRFSSDFALRHSGRSLEREKYAVYRSGT